MRYFKLPLIVTGVTIALAMVVGIGAALWIDRTADSRSRVAERISMVGGGLGTLTAIIIAPFWILAAAKLGNDRREALRLKDAKKRSSKRRSV
jgi:hypothetical protein